MADSNNSTYSEEETSEWLKILLIVVSIGVPVLLATVIFPAVGLMESSATVSTSATVIDDTSNENTYYVQPTTGRMYSSLELTFETTQSLYVDLDRSENIRVTTIDNEGINPNEMYTTTNYNSDTPPEADKVYDSTRPPYMQLVKVEIIDPSKESKIFVSATGNSSESVAVQSWTIPPESQRGSDLPQIDVEEDRVEIFPSGYF